MILGPLYIILISAGASIGYFLGSGKFLQSLLAFAVIGSVMFTGDILLSVTGMVAMDFVEEFLNENEGGK